MNFGDVLIVKNGRNQKAVENPNGRYPIYGSGGIMGYADDYICEAETVVVGRKGSINNPIFVEEPFWNVDTAFGLTARKEVLLPRYLYYFCRNYNFEQLNKTVTIPSLTKSDLLKIEITLPTLEIQQEIVDKLLKVEWVIQLRKQQLQKLDELVKARFVEMFGEHDINGYSLKDCCVDVRGGSTPSMRHPEYYGGNIPFIKSGDVRGDIVSSGVLWLTEKALMETPAKYVPKGSILIVNRSAALLREFRAAIATQPVVINQDIKAFIPKPNFVPEYLLWAIKIQSCYLLSRVTTVLTSHIDLKDLLELEIAPVSTERQTEFSKFVYEVNKTKMTVQNALDEAQLLYDSLMQKYFR